MFNETDKPIDETLARVERELEFLRQGLSLLDIKPCSSCRRFFRAEPGALFDAGHEFACFGCIPDWWSQ